ncbi:MAG TPA: Sir2 family NAD-dependent protein deacetylase [Anaerolineales bacterium]|nr:Sir2 family NAD-dependent protein deacetylase [Anaerolineales bacterium]
MNLPPELIHTLRNTTRVAVLTGVGISAESGIPTFREAQTGLWAQYDPSELATPDAFRRNPKLVWEWYAWRRDKMF